MADCLSLYRPGRAVRPGIAMPQPERTVVMVTRFTIGCEAEIGLILKLLNLFAVRDLQPDNFIVKTDEGNYQLRVDLVHIDKGASDILAARLMTIVGVQDVDCAEIHPVAARRSAA